jgi:Mg-chelatase subunit ChlD
LSAGACAPDSSNTGSGGSGGLNLVPDAGDGSFDPDAACAKFEEQGISKPVNLYVMFDKSASMAGNKWESAKAGLGAFVDDEGSAGIRVALRFFPRDPDAVPACDQQGYKEPTVPFGALPGNAAALKAAMEAEAADGFSTPMYPALGGGILMGIEMAENNPGESSAVLLVTDGQPEGPAPLCGGVDPEDPQELAALAATGASFNPPVATYVVGLPGVDQATANLIAEAGGTDSAILVANTNVEEEFREALAKVRGDAVPCVYEIPDQVLDGEVTISQVNIEVWPGGGGDPYIVPQNQSCNGEGWYYDDPANPSEIILCPDTCATLKSDWDAALRILLGCATALK